MLRPHRLPLRAVEQLARGGGDDDVLTLLCNGQFSARLVALRALLDEVVDRPLVLGLADAWDLLVAAQRKAPDLVRQVLLLPQVGVWLADLLRRLRGTVESAEPLWVEAGYLRCVATAAAYVCDIDFSLEIPVSNGIVSLPSLGIAAMPEAQQFAVAHAENQAGRLTLSCGARTVHVPADENWSPVRRIGSEGFTPLLDDVEPHRDYRAQVTPQRLADNEVRRWTEGLAEAWTLLSAEHASAVETMVSTIVPVPPTTGGRPFSGSSADAYGAVLMSLQPDAAAFAEVLAHEVQHTKLASLMNLERLCATGGSAHCYAPWRDDPRPVSGLLQGVYAFLGVTDFWRTHRQVARSSRADFEFAYWRGQTSHTARFLRECGELTALGRRFAGVMAEQLSHWSRIRVDDTVVRTARLAARDHRATWRARHLRPQPAAVNQLARAWLTGNPSLGGELPRVTLSPRAASTLARTELRRLWMRNPAEFAEHASAVPAATAADLLHVAGDQQGAARLYLADIAACPDDVGAWIGLGLTDASAGAVLRVPEVVMALHAEVGRLTGEFPDPRAVATWVGQ